MASLISPDFSNIVFPISSTSIPFGFFPECKFTKQYVEETNMTCPKDGGKVIVKKTRKGRKFFGCSNYPNCDFAAWKLEDIKKA